MDIVFHWHSYQKNMIPCHIRRYLELKYKAQLESYYSCNKFLREGRSEGREFQSLGSSHLKALTLADGKLRGQIGSASCLSSIS